MKLLQDYRAALAYIFFCNCLLYVCCKLFGDTMVSLTKGGDRVSCALKDGVTSGDVARVALARE